MDLINKIRVAVGLRNRDEVLRERCIKYALREGGCHSHETAAKIFSYIKYGEVR